MRIKTLERTGKFLSFNADVEFHIVMSPEDLGRAGLDAIGKKWRRFGEHPAGPDGRPATGARRGGA